MYLCLNLQLFYNIARVPCNIILIVTDNQTSSNSVPSSWRNKNTSSSEEDFVSNDEDDPDYVQDEDDLSNSSEIHPQTQLGDAATSCTLLPAEVVNEFTITNVEDVEERTIHTFQIAQNTENTIGEKTVQNLQPGSKKRKQFRSEEKTSRKRKRIPETWKKNAAALARDRGEEYVSYKNTVVPAKKPKEGVLCREKCRLQCGSRFNEKDRAACLEQFNKIDVNAKNALLFKSIIKKPVVRVRKGAKKHKSASYSYTVTKDSITEQVCKEAFCALYQIGRKKVDIIKSRIQSGVSVPPVDRRGHHSNRPHKMDEEVRQNIIDHIKTFPAEESHYSRNKNPFKKYLSPLLNQSKMYELYIHQCNQQNLPEKFKIKKSSYSKVFSTQFNLFFGYPKSDTCSLCDAGKSNDEHEENYRTAIELQKSDKAKVRESPTMAFITIDLQQTMPLPKLTTSKAFYLRQMWFYNFGVHIIIAKNVERTTFCTWTEDMAGRGSSEICSCLLRCIEVDDELREKDHLIVWSDSCGGQNKNFSIICLYQYLILKGYFRTIDHKFPEVGHTYLDSDRDFGRIEKVLRKHDTILVPDQYREIIAKSHKKNLVVNMDQHFRKVDNIAKDFRLYNRKKRRT